MAHGLFSFLNTTNYSFEGKKEGEEVIIFLHRHWFVIVTKLALIFLAGFLPFFFLLLFGKVIVSLNYMSVFTCIMSFYYMFLWYSIFYSLTMYTLDTWMVTNMRIINSVQRGFFNRNIAELSLDKIQDVSVLVEGAIPTFLHFGDIRVQTAGSERHFTFEQIPDPQGVKDKIMELVAIKKHEIENEFEEHIISRL